MFQLAVLAAQGLGNIWPDKKKAVLTFHTKLFFPEYFRTHANFPICHMSCCGLHYQLEKHSIFLEDCVMQMCCGIFLLS